MAATIGYLLASNIVITPLLSILDFGYLIKLYKQSKVEEQLKIARNTVSFEPKRAKPAIRAARSKLLWDVQ